MGAVALPVPPVEAVYHNKFTPVAVKAVALVFWQYTTGVVTIGAGGGATIVTVISARSLSQGATVCDT